MGLAEELPHLGFEDLRYGCIGKALSLYVVDVLHSKIPHASGRVVNGKTKGLSYLSRLCFFHSSVKNTTANLVHTVLTDRSQQPCV